AADVGRAINPQLVRRQDEGATMQGLGNALFEELIFEDGQLQNDTLLDYRVPSFEDLPDEMTCVIVENEDGPGPFGAKGCREWAPCWRAQASRWRCTTSARRRSSARRQASASPKASSISWRCPASTAAQSATRRSCVMHSKASSSWSKPRPRSSSSSSRSS